MKAITTVHTGTFGKRVIRSAPAITVLLANENLCRTEVLGIQMELEDAASITSRYRSGHPSLFLSQTPYQVGATADARDNHWQSAHRA